jgi:hypothetical protein
MLYRYWFCYFWFIDRVVILGFFFGTTVDTGAIVVVSSSNVRRPRVRGGRAGWDCSAAAAAAAAVRRFDTEDVDEDGRDGTGFFGWVVATGFVVVAVVVVVVVDSSLVVLLRVRNGRVTSAADSTTGTAVAPTLLADRVVALDCGVVPNRRVASEAESTTGTAAVAPPLLADRVATLDCGVAPNRRVASKAESATGTAVPIPLLADWVVALDCGVAPNRRVASEAESTTGTALPTPLLADRFVTLDCGVVSVVAQLRARFTHFVGNSSTKRCGGARLRVEAVVVDLVAATDPD